MTARRVEAHLPLGVEPITGPTFVCNGELAYSTDAPYEVTLTVKGEPGDTDVQWRIGRQLLAAGLVSAHGEGDVKIEPDPDSAGRMVLIELAPPHGRAVLKAGMTAVQRFLAETYGLVPEGEEHYDSDLDAELEELLRGEDPAA